MTLYSLASRALPADALCGIDASEGTSVDRIARAIEASGYGSAAAHRTAILRALGEHLCVQYTDARKVLQWLATLDRRLAVWGACACAHTALRYVPAGEHRPLRAFETTERWLAGAATIEEVRVARERAKAAAAVASAASAYAAYAAATAAAVAAYAADSASVAAYAAAYAAAAYTANARAPAWDADAADAAADAAGTTARAAELSRLVGVIADALPGIPPEPIQ